ncbi:hypothetical protein HOH11_01370 [Candidatus Woesearchaeota archaeon]|jgi:hypothetical protein|nr:hypothetical protein [Candidatus Woesearchaeota archaeon]MBT6023234.1 hypothetical protein [Candidatus Woesearchaeota archaeon]
MLNVIIILLLSSAYFLGFLLNRIAKEEFVWFQKKSKQKFGRFKYIIAALAGFSLGPTPGNTLILVIFSIILIYSSLTSTNKNPKISLKHTMIQAFIFIGAALLSKGF